jgi:sulfur-oxidizing protein SoxZ
VWSLYYEQGDLLMSVKARISIADKASKGELIEIKTLVSHPMESGFRRDGMGESIPRNILKRFSVEYGGDEIFVAEFGPGIAANPFTAFYIRADESGPVRFVWEDQNGERSIEQRQLTVQ